MKDLIQIKTVASAKSVNDAVKRESQSAISYETKVLDMTTNEPLIDFDRADNQINLKSLAKLAVGNSRNRNKLVIF